MPRFRFAPGVRNRDLRECVSPFIEIVGYSQLKDRVVWFNDRMAADPIAREMILLQNSLELALWQVVDRYTRYRRLPALIDQEKRPIESIYRAFNFVDMLTDVYRHLNKIGQTKLKGRLKQALKDKNDLSSLAQELEVINYLSQVGCAVECHDLEGRDGGADFIAERDGVEFEVECKVLTYDKGRQIHHYESMALAERLTTLLDEYCEIASKEGLLVTIRLPARLEPRPEVLDAIAECARKAVKEERSLSSIYCDAEITRFNIASSPFHSRAIQSDELSRDFIGKLNGNTFGRHFLKASPGRAALIISLDSRKPDRVGPAAYDAMKEAAKQVSGMRPAIIMVAIPTVPGEDLPAIATGVSGAGFLGLTSRLFRDESRQHIHSVHLYGDLGYGLTRSGWIGVRGQAFRYFNSNNPEHEDVRLKLEPRRDL